MSFILGKKLKMTQLWKDATVIPVTAVKVVPNKITTILTKKKNGYEAVQLALGNTKREFRSGVIANRRGNDATPSTSSGNKDDVANKDDVGNYKIGDKVTVDMFKEGDKVRVSGYSKGRGFQGVVKRHGFGGGPKTHGQKNRIARRVPSAQPHSSAWCLAAAWRDAWA